MEVNKKMWIDKPKVIKINWNFVWISEESALKNALDFEHGK